LSISSPTSAAILPISIHDKNGLMAARGHSVLSSGVLFG